MVELSHIRYSEDGKWVTILDMPPFISRLFIITHWDVENNEFRYKQCEEEDQWLD